MTDREMERLLLVAAMLGSPNDGERINALDALTRELERNHTSLTAVIERGLIEPKSIAHMFDRTKRQQVGKWWARDANIAIIRGGLSPWEKGFCQNIKSSRCEPSQKQRDILSKIRAGQMEQAA